ncbi:MAG: M13 family metallopeptidase [Armatimonadetes bacterium]|nr:M13 family metallopeptidase [Armatimonadota bacterium]MDE2207167.1 M13 family metallopeptidase [Armatimonadota bacterium]
MKQLLCLVLVCWSAAGSQVVLRAQTGSTGGHTVWTRGLDLASMDRSVDPVKDLYGFANGNWLKTTTIPPDQASWGNFNGLYLRNMNLLHQIVTDAAADKTAAPGSAIQKVGDLYASGMDRAAIDAAGYRPIQPELDDIAKIYDATGVLDTIAKLQMEGVGAAFSAGARGLPTDANKTIFGWDEGGLGLPNRDFYLSKNPRMARIRAAYVQHVATMLGLIGEPADQAAADAQTVMRMETAMAKSAMERAKRRNPYATLHVMTLAQINALTPGIDWQRYLNDLGMHTNTQVNVGNPAALTAVGKMIETTPPPDWQAYLRWHVVARAAPYLSQPFVAADFAFTGKQLRGIPVNQPRWRRIVAVTNRMLGEALGRLYVARAFPPAARERSLMMVRNLRAVLRGRLASVAWMSAATHKQALHKVDAIAINVGYPSKWRKYAGLPIVRSSFFANIQQGAEYGFRRSLSRIGKPRNRNEWGMSPPTVNAYYSPRDNSINFPAGILQPPFFDTAADDAVNYGRIGMVIGHEMTHGFDDQGRRFDASGNLKEWWTKADAAAYKERSNLIVKQYSAYVPIGTLHINGALTLGENTADIGGMRIAWTAFQLAEKAHPEPAKIDGFTPDQRFFIAYAQLWREKMRDQSLRLQINTDPHSPAEYRVIGPTSLMPEFYQAFGQPVPDWVTQRQKMMIW